jgi:transcriptional regulator with XRE-family HTH domain
MKLADRTASLVERYHAGSVNAASKDIGISQPTLARIVSGRVLNPRADALQKIASFYGVSTDWLLGGTTGGPPAIGSSGDETPQVPASGAAWLRYKALVRRLELPAPVETAVLELPSHILTSFVTLPVLYSSRGKTRQRVRWGSKVAEEAVSREIDAWFLFLSGMLAESGSVALRKVLIDGFQRIALGFSPFPVHLQRTGQLPASVWKEYETRYAPIGLSLLEPLLTPQEQQEPQKRLSSVARRQTTSTRKQTKREKRNR